MSEPSHMRVAILNPFLIAKRVAVSCLGRCDLPKHRCLVKDDIGPGPIPPDMGWLYTAKDSPDHQLRCGWRPGHISCPVLRRIEESACAVRCGKCYSCLSACGSPCSAPCYKSVTSMPTPCLPCPPRRCFPYSRAPGCYPAQCPSRVKCRRPNPRYYLYPSPPNLTCYPPMCPSNLSCLPPPCPSRFKYFPVKCSPKPRCYPPKCSPKTKCFIAACPPPPCYQPCETPCIKPMVRIIRHNGQYTIITKPDSITNHPSGPYPLKYVIDTDEFSFNKKAKYRIEAKFNEQHFDYTSSQSSFVLDFSPPDEKCHKPCPTRSSVCYPCQKEVDLKVSGKEVRTPIKPKEKSVPSPPPKPAEKHEHQPAEKNAHQSEEKHSHLPAPPKPATQPGAVPMPKAGPTKPK